MSSPSFKVGVQLHPQHTTIADLRRAARDVDVLGVDSLWTWDHFYPLYGEPEGPHFEGWTVLTVFAADTDRVQLGTLVTCNSYRNPHLLTDMARTVDHVAGGRVVLGIGAGWFEKDYEEYGYEFGTARSRLAELEESLPRIKERRDRLNPPPLGDLPILIGGGGEKVTLRLVAEHAEMWNGFADSFAHKNRVLDEWCGKVGRDPSEIERTVLLGADKIDRAEELVEAGAEHLIVMVGHPFYELEPVERLLELARS